MRGLGAVEYLPEVRRSHDQSAMPVVTNSSSPFRWLEVRGYDAPTLRVTDGDVTPRKEERVALQQVQGFHSSPPNSRYGNAHRFPKS